jgi:hypothetical protein
MAAAMKLDVQLEAALLLCGVTLKAARMSARPNTDLTRHELDKVLDEIEGELDTLTALSPANHDARANSSRQILKVIVDNTRDVT